MKLTVVRKCGHEEEIEVFGSAAERERKIAYYESTVCEDCEHEGYETIEMFYGDYKKNYSDCETKKNSYNKISKTIVVYVKKETPVVEETAETEEVEVEEDIVAVVAEMANVTTEQAQQMIDTIDNIRPVIKAIEDGTARCDNMESFQKTKAIVEYIDTHKKA